MRKTSQSEHHLKTDYFSDKFLKEFAKLKDLVYSNKYSLKISTHSILIILIDHQPKIDDTNFT